ncbi:glycosyltransferase family 2 protein [Candidatus Sumerlaeota bacterium]|nr:glycosyltransferase family 2 protein [Candidatus Sumerlaeota bacterium]
MTEQPVDKKSTITMKSVSIIVPAFNEAETITQVVQALRELNHINKEIIVVDDGSTDATAEKAHTAGADKVIRHHKNRGYGAAIKTAVNNARFDIIVTFDADLQHNPEDILKLLEHLDDETDMVVGDRSAVEPISYRKLGKWLLQRVAEFLSRERIPDLNCGLRVFRKSSFYDILSLLPDGFSFSTNLTLAMLKNDFTVKYIPISYKPRQKGVSRLNSITDGLNVLTLIFRLITIYEPMRVFLPVSVTFFILGLLYGVIMVVLTFNIPDGAVLLMVVGVLLFFFGLLAEQISELRRNLKL